MHPEVKKILIGSVIALLTLSFIHIEHVLKCVPFKEGKIECETLECRQEMVKGFVEWWKVNPRSVNSPMGPADPWRQALDVLEILSPELEEANVTRHITCEKQTKFFYILHYYTCINHTIQV